MAGMTDRSRRPNSASTVATAWSHSSSMSVGHHVPHRHIPVIKGDINFVNTTNTTDSNDDAAVPSAYIKDVLDQLVQLPINSIDHEDALEFIYDLFYMHSPYNQDDLRIARLLIESEYAATIHRCLIEFVKSGILSSTAIRRSTQFILYTLWNFSGVSIEFRLHLSKNGKLIQFLTGNLLDHIKTLDVKECPVPIINNLIQSIVSIVHNISLNGNHVNAEQTFPIIRQLLLEQEASKTNERLRLTLLLCLIHLNGKEICQNMPAYQSTFKSLFHFFKKIVQQEILMISTGLSAWIIAYAVNKLPADVVLQDDNRFYSFMILFKRGMREEKLQAGLAIDRCLSKSAHAKELLEKDLTCSTQYQQFKVFLDGETAS